MKRPSFLSRAIALAVILNLLGMPAAMALSCLCMPAAPVAAAHDMSMMPMMDIPGMSNMPGMHDMAMPGMDGASSHDGAPVGALHGGCQGDCPHGKQAMARADTPRVPAAVLSAWAPLPSPPLIVPVSVRPPQPFHLLRITSPPPSRLHCCLRI